MNLPIEFLENMKNLLDENEYEKFIESYKLKSYTGIRINSLKVNINDFIKISPFELEKIKWTEDGFYIDFKNHPGIHPYYYAGLYYIQEPSAMYPVTLLDINENDKVLDLCAAPGGKTVQIASKMNNRGLLFTNDINNKRVKALVKNVELYGIKNTIVLNESPENIMAKFTNYFDKILIDAPCSGEGMFRKDKSATKSWIKYNTKTCMDLQINILDAASKSLKESGKMVYSTCTFNPDENERIIEKFLLENEGFELIDIKKNFGVDSGRIHWTKNNSNFIKRTARLWPHKLNGEGHFAALIMKTKKSNTIILNSKKINKINKYKTIDINDKKLKKFREFLEKNLNINLDGYIYINKNNLYYLKSELPELENLNLIKFGLYLGKIEKEYFKPAHTFIISLKYEDFKNKISFNADSDEINRYLRGETLIVDYIDGFYGVFVDRYIVGAAKCLNKILKNLFPKGWRKQN